MSGAGLGFDISGLPPAIHPTDGRRSAEVENARRLACTFAGLDKLNRPRPEVLGVSLRHRMPPHVAAEIPNLICEPKGTPAPSDSRQLEIALAVVFALDYLKAEATIKVSERCRRRTT